MKVVVYPADQYGCGHHRLIWPGEELRRAGYDVTIVTPKNRHLRLQVDTETDHIVGVELPEGTDVVVLQRVTHRYLAEVVPIIRAQGVAVVIDVDDDLASIHPSNPAWTDLHPNRDADVVKAKSAKPHMHSWHNLAEACKNATLVTATSLALLQRYAVHRRSRFIPNYLADHYYHPTDATRDDVVCWPASLHSHPDDPSAVGNALQRLVMVGIRFRVASGDAQKVVEAFSLPSEKFVETLAEHVDIRDWPATLARSRVGIAPLADTRFNAAKSWLKPLELSAVGVPWVASPRAEYRRLNELGCGVLAEKPKVWYSVIRRLMRDDEWWTELSEAGLSVANDLRLSNHAWRWWEAWSEALAVERQLTTAGERRQLADSR